MSDPVAPVRIGVVGVGSLGFHHARILRELPGASVPGFFDVDAERTAEVAGKLELAAFDSLEGLLDAVDAAVVAVPTSSHEDVAVAALERGIHVLVEKPMAPTLEAADRMLDAARVSGAAVQIGHVERFNRALQGAEPFLEAPLFIESHRMAPFVPRGTDVAVVLDLMIHDVDLVQALVRSPVVEISATGIPVLTPSVDIANARLTFGSGAVANLTASRVSTERQRMLRIFQTSGYLRLNLADGSGEFLRLRHDLPALSGDGATAPALAGRGLEEIVERIPFEGPDVEPLRSELESFRDAAAGLRDPVVSGEDGRAALEVTLSIEERIVGNLRTGRASLAQVAREAQARRGS